MSNRLITSPTFWDLRRINLSSPELTVATAFYSGAGLDALDGTPKRLRFYGRLDLSSAEEWISGNIAPDALLNRAKRFAADGTDIELFVHPAAHAKFYVGAHRALIGSANLTRLAFSGSPEVLYEISNESQRTDLLKKAMTYFRLFERLDVAELERYVAEHRDRVARERRKRKVTPIGDLVAPTRRDGIPRLGSYEHFRAWLDRKGDSAAWTILARSGTQNLTRSGKTFRHNSLSGHVWRSFYGLRQYLLSYPSELGRLQVRDPETYKLLHDGVARPLLRQFVSSYAVDEGNDFSVDIWRSYVPIELGGRAEKAGGAIGSMNMMLPLVAEYLAEVQS